MSFEFNLCSLCFDQDVLVPSLMEKGIEFSSNTLSMAPGIPIKPMLAKYIYYCVIMFIALLLYTLHPAVFRMEPSLILSQFLLVIGLLMAPLK